MDKILISPSTDPAKNRQDLIDYVRSIQDYADFMHCDVMDGKFVERKTIDHKMIRFLKDNCLLPLDVHLMVENPQVSVQDYIDCGANIVTVHYECFNKTSELLKVIKQIKKAGCLAGVSIKPNTQVEDLDELLGQIDIVLVMSVEPGLSGQKFIEQTFEKIAYLNKRRKECDLSFKIEVDGGVSPDNASLLIQNGVDILVSGAYVYNAKDKKIAINKLKG